MIVLTHWSDPSCAAEILSEDTLCELVRRYRLKREARGTPGPEMAAILAKTDAQAASLLAEFREKAEQSRRAKEANGLAPLERENETVCDQIEDVRDRLFATKATSKAGTIAQLTVFREWHDLADDEGLETIIAGIRALERPSEKKDKQ